MVTLNLTGRICSDVLRDQSKSGAKRAQVYVVSDADDPSRAPLQFLLVGLGKTADELIELHQGDLVSASGRFCAGRKQRKPNLLVNNLELLGRDERLDFTQTADQKENI